MVKRRLAWRFLCICKREGADFSAVQVAEATEMNTGSARRFLRQLLRQGRLEVVWEGRCGLTHRYRLQDDSPLPLFQRKQRRKQPLVQQRIWNSCRILRTFSDVEVAATARASLITTRRYLSALERSRLLRRLATEGSARHYRLNVDLGFESPELRTDGVYAPSRQQLYPYKLEAV